MKMVSSIRELLKRHEKINCLQKSIRYFGDRSFRDMILKYRSSDQWIIQHLGVACPKKLIYMIDLCRIGNYAFYGWGGQMQCIIDLLAFADYYGLTPVIIYSGDSYYCDAGYVENMANVWEHYFEQTSEIDFDEAIKASNILYAEITHKVFGHEILHGNAYLSQEEYFAKAALIWRKYIRLNPYIQEKINKEMRELLAGAKVLGVHMRIKVFSHDLKGHPKAASLDEYLDIIDYLVKSVEFDKIFLATAEKETVSIFRERYGDKLLVYDDVFRTNSGEINLEESERENHKFRLGYEALRDSYTLAHCNGLIAGLSMISILTQVINESLSADERYTFKKIFNKGINIDGITVEQYWKKELENGK